MNARLAPLDVVRRAIGRAWIAGSAADAALEPPALGGITLHPHQQRAVARLLHALDARGGALLADAVGLGKTYVALAVAHRLGAVPPLVVAPAALRATWRRAAARAAVEIRFTSIESLSRRALGVAPGDAPRAALVVVDEAHHARNRATRRWRALADACIGARVLLLTATPIHNHPGELRALLALFLGARADRLDGDALLRLVVRRGHDDVVAADTLGTRLPTVEAAPWRHVRADPSVAAAVRAIPPPAPMRDARGEESADGDALWRMSLARAWASSDAALRVALHRRLAVAAALDDALAAGRRPTRREIAAWQYDDAGAMQLAMPLLVTADAADDAHRATLHATVAAHASGVRHVLRALEARGDRDDARVRWLRAVRRRHVGCAVVAFTVGAATARMYYRRMRADGGVALLTARGGEVAGGRVSRADLLARFAPSSVGAPAPRQAERVTLLVATDCLSEGLDLRDASVVVHLDVPWTPARLAQRVGRAVRLGSPHAAVAVHGLAPPADAAAWLALRRRLRRKTRAARRTLGDDPDADATHAVSLGRTVERWAALDAGEPTAGGIPVACVEGAEPAFLALVRDAGVLHLVAGARGRASSASRRVARAVRRIDTAAPSKARPPDVARALRHARRALRRWRRRSAAAELTAIEPQAGVASAVAAALSVVVRAAPPHARATIAARAARVRSALAAPLGAGLEAEVRAALAGATLDAAWLDRIAAILSRAARPAAPTGAEAARVLALIVVCPPRSDAP